MLKGHRGTADGSEKEFSKRNIRNSITKSTSFQEKMKSDIEEMEKHLETEINGIQNVGIKNIIDNIEENFQLKLREIERQLAETVKRDENKEAIESLENERVYIEHMLTQSKNVNDVPTTFLGNLSLGPKPKPKPCNIL